MFTEHQIRWDLPPERGWAYIHAANVYEGMTTEWETADQLP